MLQIEGRRRLLGNKLLEPRIAGLRCKRTQVFTLQRQRNLRRDMHRLPVFPHDSAQRLMPGNKLLQAAHQRRFIQLTLEVQRGAFIEGAIGLVAKLRAKQDLALRLRDLDVALNRRGRSNGHARAAAGVFS